ncbi:hypothetical protein AM493_09320 [Flavobacterium akiainvivens]|uniref:AB hydrolase-1 domain-containing protein n=1 Tax=Flavobacterium akiainvivens TaxID=1202724 RepID=A0A0M8MI16_9FLAO|nr:alpha/beta fold hydrolase [Flavobacterium akiainvivens]KOS06207.1 hypothetical protein AM493_09320 [Flavobacterium akiainvivens]SFQ68546.1 hypothetical protein SAMN05444144_11498 [Flavobacterium akiainvivens]
MKKAKKIIVRLAVIVLALYALVLVLLYFYQEKLLFHPEVIGKDTALMLPKGVSEEYIAMADGVKLNGLLLRNKNAKGLVFYLHGNGGNAAGWGESILYAFPEAYDLFVLDYRGYGKSEGTIQSEAQLIIDVTTAFDYIVKKYDYKSVVVDGYSIGTGPATQLAAKRDVKALILQAPYYSLSELIDTKVPLVPDFVKRYKLETCNYITKVKAPVYIFHGTEDKLIPYSNCQRLKQAAPDITVIPIRGVGHNGINESQVFRGKVEEILR